MFQVEGRLFVYGSLVRPAVLDRVIGHPHPGQRLRARLQGFARATVPGWDYPLLFRDAEAVTDGVLILDLSKENLQALDAYEEVDDGAYCRIPVTVETWGCGPGLAQMEAETYLAGPRFQQLSSSLATKRPTVERG